jgi:mazG nucleotide pyrophosphohydrolase domain
MTINEYQEAALRTANMEVYKNDTDMLLNGILGLTGESGECSDMIKKHLYQGHSIDREHLVKELGDIAWYLAVSAKALGYDLESVLQMNVDKLKKRYPEGFSVERSLHRKEDDV